MTPLKLRSAHALLIADPSDGVWPGIDFANAYATFPLGMAFWRLKPNWRIRRAFTKLPHPSESWASVLPGPQCVADRRAKWSVIVRFVFVSTPRTADLPDTADAAIVAPAPDRRGSR